MTFRKIFGGIHNCLSISLLLDDLLQFSVGGLQHFCRTHFHQKMLLPQNQQYLWEEFHFSSFWYFLENACLENFVMCVIIFLMFWMFFFSFKNYLFKGNIYKEGKIQNFSKQCNGSHWLFLITSSVALISTPILSWISEMIFRCS